MENQIHILLAENEFYTRLSLALILEDAGYKVTHVENGVQAWIRLTESFNSDNPIDLLVTDIQMPVMTGIELIDKIFTEKIPIPIIVITGFKNSEVEIITSFDNSEFQSEFTSKNYNYVLEKPSDPEDLLKNVKNSIEEYDHQRTAYPSRRKNQFET